MVANKIKAWATNSNGGMNKACRSMNFGASVVMTDREQLCSVDVAIRNIQFGMFSDRAHKALVITIPRTSSCACLAFFGFWRLVAEDVYARFQNVPVVLTCRGGFGDFAGCFEEPWHPFPLDNSVESVFFAPALPNLFDFGDQDDFYSGFIAFLHSDEGIEID